MCSLTSGSGSGLELALASNADASHQFYLMGNDQIEWLRRCAHY